MASAAPSTTARATAPSAARPPDAARALASNTVRAAPAPTGPQADQNKILTVAVLPSGVSTPANMSSGKSPRNTLTSAPATSTGTATTSSATGRGSPVATASATTGTPAAVSRTRAGTAACHQARDLYRNGRGTERRVSSAARPGPSPHQAAAR